MEVHRILVLKMCVGWVQEIKSERKTPRLYSKRDCP